jgi:ribosome-binding protein aMBF1 (putative translation factor)
LVNKEYSVARLNKIIRESREMHEMTRSHLARKLNISKGYLEHMEYGTPVHISERLYVELKRILGIGKPDLALLIKRHNARALKLAQSRRKAA